MNRLEKLEAEWKDCFTELMKGEFMTRLSEGRLEIEHYKGFLRETFHNASHNPKNMALFQAHIHSSKPHLEAKILKHAAMEIGHDEMALNDLLNLGGDPQAVRSGRPLPTTEALAAFAVFQIQHRNPVGYLGYLYHLEALPIQVGESALGSLLAIGVPENATSFLREHSEADPVHLKWNKEYLEGFIQTEDDFQAVLYGLRGTCELHGIMLQGIIDHSKKIRPKKALAA